MKTENKQTETVSRKNLIDEAAAIRKMSFVSVAGNAVLSGFKFFAGVTGNSGAMISDSIHSFSDVITTVIAWIGVKASKKEADSAHPYGHERMECIASLFLGIILLATGLGVGKVGLENIISGDYETLAIPGTISLVAAIVSIVSKEAMYWYTRYYARLINSSAFLADAWHHRSDAFSSIGSLIGIGGAMGRPFCSKGTVHNQRKSWQSFRSEHTFFSIRLAAASITGLTFRAEWGQTEIQRMQEIHAFSSTFFGFSLSMACTGYSAAQAPHLVHSFVGLGTMPAPPAFL